MAGASYYLAPSGSVTIPNDTVLDMEISGLALGLLTWIRGRPPGASQSYREFLSRGFGEAATRRALAELEAAGYRWRFVERRQQGRIVTATLLFDRPSTEAEARKVLESMTDWPLGKCLSRDEQGVDTGDGCGEQQDNTKRGDHAVKGRTRKSPSRTVQRFSAARSTAARSTVQRSGTAQPSNDGSSGWVTDVTQPNQTGPASEQSPPPEAQSNRVGSGLDGVLNRATREMADGDWDVLVECLPPRMRRIEPSGIAKVAAALRKRVEAGWTPDALRAVLAGNSLPPDSEIQNLTGIVSYRIGQIPSRPPKRTKRIAVRSEPQPTNPTVVPLALQKRAEARAEGSPDAGQPMSWWFEQYPPTKTDERGELA